MVSVLGMTLEFTAVTFDVSDVQPAARFWGRLLERRPRADRGGILLVGDETQVGLRFGPPTTNEAGQDYLHLHVTSEGVGSQDRVVERAVELGAVHADVGQLPEEDHVVVADPAGNAFCVIPPGNNFLAGCGLLGEVTCDGSREVGIFWRDALGWDLVWDEDGETAVQALQGGTKLSWGGPPIEPKTGRCSQRFLLSAADPSAEAQRLTALGATVLHGMDDETGDEIELADPDGHEFSIRRR